jgi:hypothetical protein
MHGQFRYNDASKIYKFVILDFIPRFNREVRLPLVSSCIFSITYKFVFTSIGSSRFGAFDKGCLFCFSIPRWKHFLLEGYPIFVRCTTRTQDRHFLMVAIFRQILANTRWRSDPFSAPRLIRGMSYWLKCIQSGSTFTDPSTPTSLYRVTSLYLTNFWVSQNSSKRLPTQFFWIPVPDSVSRDNQTPLQSSHLFTHFSGDAT